VHFGVFGDSSPLLQNTDLHTASFGLALPPGSAYDTPGWIDISLSTPQGGPGGGTSNTIYFPFLRSYNALASAGNNGYFLLPSSGIQQFSLNSASSINQGGAVADPNGIAVDDKTGYVLESSFVEANYVNVGILDSSLNYLGDVVTTDNQVINAVAAGGGYGCASIPGDKSVAMFPLRLGDFQLASTIPMPSGVSTGSNPWPVVMTSISAKPSCVVFDASDTTLSVVQVQSNGTNQLVGTSTIANITPYSVAIQQTTFVGWQLVSFDLSEITVTATSQENTNLSDYSVVTIDPNTSATSVMISPSSMPPYNGPIPAPTQQFTATIFGTTNTGVEWYVGGILGGNSNVGTITSTGFFTPPLFPLFRMIDITAVSNADVSKSASAYKLYCSSISCTGNVWGVPIGISPEYISIQPGGKQQFTAVVADGTNVTWSVNGIQGGNSTVGTITNNGLYTAPASSPAKATGTIALLSQADGVVVFLNPATRTELRRASIPGIPISVAADNADGAAIVASANISSGLTQFYRVDVGTGVVTLLNSTTTLLANGLQVSFDGKSIYACMRSQCQVLPNN
jgi:hypothetical protein